MPLRMRSLEDDWGIWIVVGSHVNVSQTRVDRDAQIQTV